MSAITICKFYTNPVPSENDNALISRTLLKVSVIDRRWEPSCGQQPRDGEFWQVEVVREFGESMKGCFLLHPKARIHESDVRSLIPGTYDIEAEAGLIVITPHNPGNWVLPIPHRKLLADKYGGYAIIVDIQKFMQGGAREC
jgi:hypothetical protein